MREIKFRQWHDGKMNYLIDLPFAERLTLNKHIKALQQYSELMYYTTKSDKNGKEIYDSDITKFEFNGENLIGAFKYNEEELRYELDIYQHDDYLVLSYDCTSMSDFEVIGNIHENPEMLEK